MNSVLRTNPFPLPEIEGWEVKTIDQLCVRVTSGGTPSRTNSDYFRDGTINWFKTRELKGWYLEDSEEQITELALKESSARLLPPGTILMAMYGDGDTITNVGILAGAATCNQACCAMIVDQNNCDPLFLFYSLKAYKEHFLQIASGGAQRNLSGFLIRHFGIPIPPSLAEQREIAGILGALDDKIDLNRRMNATLEATARALFQSWFVDFDPVRAKAEGRQPEGMDAETAALFPDAFEDSALGAIPRGWKVSTVDYEFKVTMGQSPPGDTYNEIGEGLPFYQGRRDFGFRYPTRRVFCTQPTRFAEAGETLVSVRAPVGDLNMALERCSIGRGVGSMLHRSGSRSLTYYAAQFLKPYFENYNSEGTVFGAIGSAGFRNIPFVQIPPELVDQFDRLASPFDAAIENCERSSMSLAQTRDALLPKLLSGEMRVGSL